MTKKTAIAATAAAIAAIAATAEAGPLSETIIPKIHEATAAEVVEDLRSIVLANPEKVISRNYYRVNGKYSESAWSQHFGVFSEFKRQAGVVLTRQQHAHERAIAKHASVDHYRAMATDRADWGDRYARPSGKRYKTLAVCSDLHDKEIDPFSLRVWLDTLKRAQPEHVVFGGDLFDLPEFGKYGVDPREWDVVGRIEFAHNEILGPSRDAAPSAEMDVIEGNHEARMLRQLADATPALRAVLSDLHGFTVSKLFGLDRFEINYHAKSDLASYTKQEFGKELQNNYKVYDDAFMVHHFPQGRNMGIPGVNGHHHRHVVWNQFNVTYGAYEWHQLGSMHRRSASYCEGEYWHNGFALVHIDTQTKAVNIEYIPVTDHAVVGGQWYFRAPSEIVSTGVNFGAKMG